MLAAVFAGPGILELQKVPEPRILQPTDVKIEVDAAGICGTDLKILSVPQGHPGNVGVVMGHEYTGHVVEVGSGVDHLKPGDTVVVGPNLNCLTCTYCLSGAVNLCENVTTLGIFINGGLARYSVVPARAAYRIADHVPPYVRVWAEPLSNVVGGVRRLSPFLGESAVVLGGGPIGLLYVQLLRAMGVGPIILSEPTELRRELALACGATRVINPTTQYVEEILHAEIGLGADIVIDAVGSLFEQALSLARPNGRILLFGQNSEAISTIRQNDITRRELTVLGSYATRGVFPATIHLLESGSLDLEPLTTHRLPLEEITLSIEAIKEGKAGKVVLLP